MVSAATLVETTKNVNELTNRIDVYWVHYNAFSIFFMTFGFTLLEMGYSRYKNWSFTVLKNVLTLCVGALSWWLWGFAFAYGVTGSSGIGTTYFAEHSMKNNIQLYNDFITGFSLAMTTMIISGTMILERTNPLIYILWSTCFVGLAFPLGINWGWHADGWLRGLGFFDFSGAAIVHIAGASSGLAALLLVGSRNNKDDQKFLEERPNEFRHSSTIHIGLGVFILWFTWFAFSPGNLEVAVATDTYNFSKAIGSTSLNNVLGSSAAGIFMLLYFRIFYEKYDYIRTTNAILAGLIAVSAGGNWYTGWESLIIGSAASVTYLIYSILNEKYFKIDDPREAFSLHYGAGTLGLIAIAFFHRSQGLFYIPGGKMVGANFLGLVIYTVFPFGFTFVLFLIFRSLGLLTQTNLVLKDGNDNVKVGGIGCTLDNDSTKVYYSKLLGKNK